MKKIVKFSTDFPNKRILFCYEYYQNVSVKSVGISHRDSGVGLWDFPNGYGMMVVGISLMIVVGVGIEFPPLIIQRKVCF